MNRYFRHILFAASFFMLCMMPFGASGQGKDAALKLTTVVIDPGHGGKDPGSVSKDGKTYEKNLTLSIAKQFGKIIKDNYPDVKVIYTRTTDKFVALGERADIANRNKADLFVSIHINAVPQSTPNGFSVHILGQSTKKGTDLFTNNMNLCRRENSVIMLEEDYTTKYQGFNPNDPESFIFFNLMQNAHYEQSLMFAADIDRMLVKGPIKTTRGVSQDPFLVLWRTTMPAVLVEAGFITNPNDLKVLNTESGRNQIAQRLFEAFKEFKRKYDGSLEYDRKGQQGGQPESSSGSRDDAQGGGHGQKYSGGTAYGIQILLLSRNLQPGDNALKGYSFDVFQAGNMYKYIVGTASDEKSVRDMHAKVRRDFPDSFIVKIEDGKVSRL